MKFKMHKTGMGFPVYVATHGGVEYKIEQRGGHKTTFHLFIGGVCKCGCITLKRAKEMAQKLGEQ